MYVKLSIVPPLVLVAPFSFVICLVPGAIIPPLLHCVVLGSWAAAVTGPCQFSFALAYYAYLFCVAVVPPVTFV